MNAKKRKKIFIIDDHPVVRYGLKQMINLEKNLEVCGEAATVNEAIKMISKKLPDLVIVDLTLDEEMSGLDVIKAVKTHHQNIVSMVISIHEETVYVDRAIRAGAMGYLSKKYAHNTIIEAINKVLSGELYLSENISTQIINNIYHTKKMSKETLLESLSDRELEIFCMIGNGYDTGEIARKLGLSENTIHSFKRQIRKKLDLKNHHELVRKATLYLKLTL